MVEFARFETEVSTVISDGVTIAAVRSIKATELSGYRAPPRQPAEAAVRVALIWNLTSIWRFPYSERRGRMRPTQIEPAPAAHDRPSSSPAPAVGAVAATRSRRELILFFVLAVFIWPFIAVGVVAGWGFVVWMYYLFTGPPGPV
jgi:nitrate reductase NapE